MKSAPRQGCQQCAAMPSTHTSLHYHLVFSTKQREPWIDTNWRAELHALPRRHCQRARRPSGRHRRRGGSRSPACLAQTHSVPIEFHPGSKKIILGVGEGIKAPRFPMAGGIRGLHRECLGQRERPALHRWPGGTSSGEIVPGGAGGVFGEIRRFIRSEVSGLNASTRLASLRDAESGGVCAPVVSLRSTTGYKRRSLRLPLIQNYPGGISSCSRWLSAATPPDIRRDMNRTPAGVRSPFTGYRRRSLWD